MIGLCCARIHQNLLTNQTTDVSTEERLTFGRGGEGVRGGKGVRGGEGVRGEGERRGGGERRKGGERGGERRG